MDLIFPNENEVMMFFQTHSDFHTVYRISELLISPHHNNIQDDEWQHVRSILHRLKRDDFLIVQSEGGDIHEEKFGSTPDRVQRYFEKHHFDDLNNLQNKTDDELKEIMRARIENQHLPHSIYHRAKQELDFRRQSGIINHGIIAGGSVTAGGNINVGSADGDSVQKKWWKRPEIIIPIVIAFVSIPGLSSWLGSETPQNNLDQPVTQSHEGSGDNVAGDKVVNNQYSSFPAREVDPDLISSIEKCSNPDNPYHVAGVVESSLISGPAYDETDKFKDIVAEKIGAESTTIIYRSGAIVPDGIKVWSASSTNFVYIGQNSLSGKRVECVDAELRLGYSAWELQSLEFQIKNDGYPVMDFVARIYDHESNGQENFSLGAIKYSDGKWRPGINSAPL